jgi:CheY-like chemotaxis protein
MNTTVLLVEDDDIDAAFVEDELKKVPAKIFLTHVRDGEECMQYLRDPALRLPDVVFLDLKMPKKDGREVLGEMMADPILRVIPVVVISGSDVDSERLHAYALGANGYVHKPADRARFVQVMEDVWRYWLVHNRPPPHPVP